MSQPAQPGQDANADAVKPSTPAPDTSQQVEAAGANARLRQDAGLAPADNTQETAAPKEPAADAKLREATPGFESVPTDARDVNTSARAIDDINAGGPVRVREASFSTADGQTMTGSVYPKGSSQIFMSKEGQKYTVDKNDNGDISLRPESGQNSISVQDNGSRGQPSRIPGTPTDQQAPGPNPNAAGAAAERAATQQAQQEQAILAQQRAERPVEQQKQSGAPAAGRPDNPVSQPEKSPESRPDKSVGDDAQGNRPPLQRPEPQDGPEQQRGPVIGSGSARGDKRGVAGDSGKDDSAEAVANVHSQMAQNEQIAPSLRSPQPNINIKVGDAIPPAQALKPVNPGMDRQLDQTMSKPTDKPADASAETAPAANARSNPVNVPVTQPQNLPVDTTAHGLVSPVVPLGDLLNLAIRTPNAINEANIANQIAVQAARDLVTAALAKGGELTLANAADKALTGQGQLALHEEGQPDGTAAVKIAVAASTTEQLTKNGPLAKIETLHEEGQLEGVAGAKIAVPSLAAELLTKDAPIAKTLMPDKSGVGDITIQVAKKVGDTTSGAVPGATGKGVMTAKDSAISKDGAKVDHGADGHLEDRREDLKEEEGEVATGTDATTPSGSKKLELEEKDKEKKEEDTLEGDTLNSRNAMIAAMLTDKSKQEAIEKEEQLAINDSKKKGEDKRRRYVVKDKDTLESIAKKQLRDIRLAALIYDINKHMLPLRMEKGKQVAEPRSGTSIWLPSDADIRDFRGRLYSTTSAGPTLTPVAARGGAPAGALSPKEELAEKFGQNWEGGPGSSAISAGLMEAAVSKSQVRQSNIEKVLGPIASPRTPEGSRIRYIVRLSDTIDGVAIKHPALKDIDLWPLLARLNDLPDDIDASGRPLAELRRGMVLNIPFPYEIEAFRRGAQADEVYPSEVSAAVDLHAPTVKVSVTSPTEAPNYIHSPISGQPTIPIQAATAPLQPSLSLQPSPALQTDVAPPPDAAGQEPTTMPLPASLFQSYQAGQPTVPLPAMRGPASAAPIVPQAPGSASPPSPGPADANDLLAWQGGQAAAGHQNATQQMPQHVPQSTSMPAQLPESPPAQPVPQLGQLAPQLGQLAPQPSQLAPQPGQLAPQPGQLASQPGQLASQPAQPVPQPAQPVPQPAQSAPQPAQLTPQPAQSAPSLTGSLPSQQTLQMPAPSTSSPAIGGWQQSTSYQMPPSNQGPPQPSPDQTQQPLQSHGQPQGMQPVPFQPTVQLQQFVQSQTPMPPQQPPSQPQPPQPPQPPLPQPPPQQFMQPQQTIFPQQQPLPGQSHSSMPAIPTGSPPAFGSGQPPLTTVESPRMSAPIIKPVNRPTAADIMKRAPIVVGDRYMWELDRSVRLVKSAVRWEPAIGVFRSQLEVLYRETWYPVIFYEVFPQGAVRHEYVGGGKRKSVKMDLPPSAVQELADNDLVNNWQAYCQRFVSQLMGPKP